MKKILAVGKDPKICQDPGKHFDSQEYRLLFSCDHKNAIASMINLKPDLIILDLNLPQHGGVEISKKVKESNSNLPLAASTDSSSNLTKMDIIKEDVYAFVKRPFSQKGSRLW
jgi:DNA-binding response OmpR family regulator